MGFTMELIYDHWHHPDHHSEYESNLITTMHMRLSHITQSKLQDKQNILGKIYRKMIQSIYQLL